MQQYPDTNRINLLTENEISSLYDRPILSANQRKLIFVFDNDTIETMEQMNHKNRCYQLLQMGYFSVTRTIHHFSFKEVQDDLKYVCETYFPGTKLPRGSVPTSTRTHLGAKTLEIYGYEKFQKEQLKWA